MVFDKDIPEGGILIYWEQVIENSARFKKKPIKNSHEMIPYWQAQNIKLETQKE